MNTDNAATPFFKEPKPRAIRVWHWLTFLFFSATIATVIFASTLFTIDDNISMVQRQVVEKGGSLTESQARNVAHEYSDKLWMLHKYIGFGLCILLFLRIVAEAFIRKEKRLKTSIRKALSYPVKSKEQKHYLFVQFSYFIFYVLFLVMALTGLVLAFEDIAFLKVIRNPAKELHEIIQWALYAYVILHITGTIIADSNRYNGLVSRMIHGKTKEEERND